MTYRLPVNLKRVFAGVAACMIFAGCESAPPDGAQTEGLDGVPSYREAVRIINDSREDFRKDIHRSYASDRMPVSIADSIRRFQSERCVADTLSSRMAVDDFYIRHILPVIARDTSDDESDRAAQIRDTTQIIKARQTFDALGIMLACDRRNGWDPADEELHSSVLPDLQGIYPEMQMK